MSAKQENQTDTGVEFLPPSAMMMSLQMMQAAAKEMAEHPHKWVESQQELCQHYMLLWSNAMARMMGQDVPAYNVVSPQDRRFKDQLWSDSLVFDTIRQSYCIMQDWFMSNIAKMEEVDPKVQQKMHYFTRQWLDAAAPSNFGITNPEVLRETLASGGENLIKGLQNFIEDLGHSKDMLDVSMVDRNAFEVGKDLATSPGKVVFENRLMQLIQYAPSTQKVNETPMLIIPPWINKYYILDLQAKNSMVKWLVDQGHTVFMISWANPDASFKDVRFDDYMMQGVLEAMDVVDDICGTKRMNLVGYCIGGTLLSMTLAYLKAKKQDKRAKTATFFTTLLDFSMPGELGIFVDDLQIKELEKMVRKEGVFDGEYMSFVFRSLRASDLIWSFVVNNYLLGKTPFPFDLLYWNADKTSLPAEMYLYYMRNMYLQNDLIKPGCLKAGGVPVDLSTIDTPTYAIAAKEDHIAPWKSSYAITHLLGSDVRFVLSESGHIAGVVNPPEKKKYGFWSSDAKSYAEQPDMWLEQAQFEKSSWWEDWNKWLTKSQKDKKVDVKKRCMGSKTHPPIEDAPGRYVKVRGEA